jgi:hypothetical protein
MFIEFFGKNLKPKVHIIYPRTKFKKPNVIGKNKVFNSTFSAELYLCISVLLTKILLLLIDAIH